MRYVRQVYDPEADDYVPLPEAVPDTDPRYHELIADSRAALRLAGRKERGEE